MEVGVIYDEYYIPPQQYCFPDGCFNEVESCTDYLEMVVDQKPTMKCEEKYAESIVGMHRNNRILSLRAYCWKDFVWLRIKLKRFPLPGADDYYCQILMPLSEWRRTKYFIKDFRTSTP